MHVPNRFICASVSISILAFVLGCQKGIESPPAAGSDKGDGPSGNATQAGGADAAAIAVDAGPEELSKLIEALKSDDDEVEARAAARLAAMGTAAAPAVEALTAELEDENPQTRAQAAKALGRIGDAAKPAAKALARAIADKDASVRRSAIGALRRIKPGEDMVVPLMIEALASTDDATRLSAVRSLAEFGEAIVPTMIKGMSDDRTVYWACLVLGEVGPKAKDAVPALATALEHKHPEVRHEAAYALRSIGPDAKDAVPQLTKAMDDKQLAVRRSAALALGTIGPAAAEALPALQKHTQHEDELMTVNAIWAVEKVKPDPNHLKTVAAPALIKFLKNKDKAVRQTAALGLLDLNPGPAIMVPAFSSAIQDEDPAVVSDMLSAIASLGAPAVPRLIKALEFPKARLRVVEILGRIGPAASDAVPALVKYANDPDANIRREVFATLGSIGPAAKSALPAATAALKDEDDEVRYSALFALGKMGPAAKEALDELGDSLNPNDPYYCKVCAWAMVQIDPDDEENAKRALPLMIDALDDEESFVRGEAAATLGLLGSKAKDALSALKTALEDEDEHVRDMAAAAIKKIEGN